MSYFLYDADGKYLGDLATTIGLFELRKYAQKGKFYNLLGFLDKGAALVTQVLIEELKGMRPSNADMREIIDNLIKMIDEAELCVIISDGVNT